MTNRNWKKTLIKSNRNIRDAIKTLEIAELQVLLVVDDNNKLKGTLTDGDIRRAILKGADINSKIGKYIKRKPFYLRNKNFSKNNKNKKAIVQEAIRKIK